MSTIDPDAIRREREARVPGASELAPLAAVTFILPALAALLARRMLAGLIATDTFDWTSIVTLIVMVVSAPAVILAIIRWMSLSPRNPRLLGLETPIGLALLGVAAGLSLAADPPAWVQAPQFDIAVLILAALGLALLILSLRNLFARSRRAAADADIMRASAPVTGVVTNQGYTMFTGEQQAFLTTVTYAFEDESHTRRYVQVFERIPKTDPLVDGEEVDLWFDRADPSNTRRIVIRRRGARGRR